MKKLILVVEDHKDQNERLCNIVTELGHEPIAAFDGIEALSKLREYRRGFGFLSNRIDCVLLDWSMPKMRGEEFIKIVRRQENWNTLCVHIPIVIVTAYDDEEKRAVASNRYVGMAAGYITKPYNREEIKDTIQRIVVDQDAASLIEMNRAVYFNAGAKERYEEQLKQEEESRRNFIHGSTSESSLAFLDKYRLDLEILCEECEKTKCIDAGTLANLQSIKDLFAREYFKLSNKVHAKK